MKETVLIELSCPECSTVFDVECGLLGNKGRYVACSECQYQWFQEPPRSCEELPLLSSQNDIEEEDVDMPTHEPPPIYGIVEEEVCTTNRKTSMRGFLLVTVSFFCVLFTCFFFLRNDLVRNFPPIEGVYKALGISAHDLSSFQFQNTHWRLIREGTYKLIEVTGDVTNLSGRLLSPPAIQVTVRGSGTCQITTWMDRILGLDQGGSCVIKKWVMRLKEGRFFSGQTVFFKVVYPLSFDDFPQNVSLKFVNREV